ncbi:MAG: FKBP-type peptidyl-prolyl cis-trans isomerase [Bacteroidia bacterium]|nr:FKBP-type peptidyl-prolyl cis-trans isomerase [Bacteroidia bacterium]
MFFAIIIITGCENNIFPGYTKTVSGIYYKIHKFGEGTQKPKPTDYITVDIEYRTIKQDSVFFSGRRKFQTTLPDYPGSVDECFAMMSVDDSAGFIINAYKFFRKTIKAPLPSFFNSKSNIRINVKLLNIQSRADFLKEKEEFLSWIKDLEEYEKTILRHFIKEKDISIQPARSGLYCIKTIKTNGAQVKNGDLVIVHYEGQYLNGKYFDSTKERNMPFELLYGKEMQVVKGLEEGIGMMREGEKAILIMPSKLAFGQKGSSTGIIPPYTTVIFRVEVLSIKSSIK